MATPGRINLSRNISIQILFDFGKGNSRLYRISNLGKGRMTVLQDEQTFTSDNTFLLEAGLSADFFAWRLTVMREEQSFTEGTYEAL